MTAYTFLSLRTSRNRAAAASMLAIAAGSSILFQVAIATGQRNWLLGLLAVGWAASLRWEERAPGYAWVPWLLSSGISPLAGGKLPLPLFALRYLKRKVLRVRDAILSWVRE